MTENHIASLDIGSGKVIAALAHIIPNKQIEIIGLSKQSHQGAKRGLVLNREEIVHAIKTCTDDVFKQSGIRINSVRLNFNGQFIKMIKKRLYLMPDPAGSANVNIDFKTLINQQYKFLIEDREEIIHVFPDKYNSKKEQHANHRPEMAADKTGIDFSIIISNRTAILNLKKAVHLAGLDIDNIVPEPIASSYSVLANKEKEEGVMLVDIGRDTTNIAIYQKNTLRNLLVFPAGSGVITSDIKIGFNISRKQAEALKVQFRSATDGNLPGNNKITVPGNSAGEQVVILPDDLSYIIRTRTEEIIDLLSPGLRDSENANSLKHGIVITGGGALLKNIDLLIKDKTGLKVRVGIPSVNVKNENKIQIQINNPVYASAIGLLNHHTEHN